ncbi:hypothetical protein [Kitasatospora camelliae]|uniref:Uncharacterized protein n=1 Tax=Kitasatospora camelliae TaxID=3156397 RepID=A0AAU8JZV0_9ACTN
MLTPGREDGPLTPGERLVRMPGFWAAYLRPHGTGDPQPLPTRPELFGATAAQVEAVRVALAGAEGPGPFAGRPLSWPQLLHAARHPGAADPVTDRRIRLLLLLPRLAPAAALPDDAAVTVASALAAVGVPPSHRATLAQSLLPGPAACRLTAPAHRAA